MSPLQFPDVPPGPLRDYFLELHRIHSRAGGPSTRKMAEAVDCSHHKIHQIFTQPRLPRDGDILLDLMAWLGRQGRRPLIRSDEDEARFLDSFDKYYDAAQRFVNLRPYDSVDSGAGAVAIPSEEPETHGSSPSLPNDGADVVAPSPVAPPEQTKPKEPDNNGIHDGGHDLPGRLTQGDTVAGDKISLSETFTIGKIHTSPAHFGNHNVAGWTSAPTESRPEFPEPMRSSAVFVGVGAQHHPELSSIPSAAAGAADLHKILTDVRRPGGFDPQRTVALIDPVDPQALLEAVDRARATATDTLLVYFAGHGLISSSGELLLATSNTRPEADYTAVRFDDIRRLLATAPSRRTLVVLDCCFSGRAISDVMAHPSDLAHTGGTYVLTSTPANSVAFAPSNNRYPVFTESLIDVLLNGASRAAELLTLDVIYSTVRDSALRRSIPAPRRQASGALGNELALGWNPNYLPKTDLSVQAANPQIMNRLTPREHEVVSLLASGRSTKDIAARLHVAESTVRATVARARARFQKLAPVDGLNPTPSNSP